MIDRIGSASANGIRPEEEDDDRTPTGAAPTPASRSEAFATGALSAHIDGGLAEFVRASAKRDDILHVGMNRSSADAEVKALSRQAHVTALAHDGMPDLNTAAGREALAAMLRARGMGSEQADAVLRVIDDTNPTGKDEIAQLALLWTAGERGEAVPGRLVLSGHSSGDVFWDGGGDGELAFDDVRRLARVMPRAAAQIEDIHISACSTGGQAALAENRASWLEAFPSLKTFWAYDGAAPHEGGAHLSDWARATKGATDRLALTADRAKGHVAVWDRVGGYRDGNEPLAAMRVKQQQADGRFDAWMTGARTPAGSEDPALVADYRTYRALAGRSDLPKSERDACWTKAEQLLRLRYFDGGVRREIERAYGPTIAKGFEALGLAPPRIGALSHREVLAQIDAFEQAASARAESYDADVAHAREILTDLRALEWSRIPASWCRH